ncbi:MAG: PilZ domain-containing protein [Candidatus Omnitrophota bacterium]
MQRHSGQEKRKRPRVDVNFVVSYRVKKDYSNNDLSQSKNISQGGMLLTTNCKFEKGTYLAMKIRFPFAPERKIEIVGEVVESREVMRNFIYETRLKFLDFNKDMLDKLGDFIDGKK